MIRPLFTLWFGNRKMAIARSQVAESLESKGQYKDACYSYALALHLGIEDKNLCIQKVAHLWQTHGPFDYSDKVKELEEQKDGCGLSGHERTMRIIGNIIGNKKKIS